MTVLDIGTNIGVTILPISERIGDNGKVYGFEPDKRNFKIATKNISLNNFKNIQIENIGLGSEDERKKMSIEVSSNRGMNKIVTEELANQNYETIEVQKLDNWIVNKNITSIDLVKMDVEGYEHNIIKGGIETLKKYLPILFIEIDDNMLKSSGTSAKDLITTLESIGYDDIYDSETNSLINSHYNFTNCHIDIIAKPVKK